MLNILIAVLLAVVQITPVSALTVPDVTTSPAAARVEFVDLPADQVEIATWAVGLYDEAGLELPAIRFVSHGDDADACGGWFGLSRGDGGRQRDRDLHVAHQPPDRGAVRPRARTRLVCPFTVRRAAQRLPGTAALPDVARRRALARARCGAGRGDPDVGAHRPADRRGHDSRSRLRRPRGRLPSADGRRSSPRLP